jgi:antitoxin ParD1/3/4
MSTMNISLSETMREFVNSLVEQGGYSTASEYVRELIRNDQKRKAQEKLESLLVEGLESGESISVTPEFWTNVRADLTGRLKEGAVEEPSD